MGSLMEFAPNRLEEKRFCLKAQSNRLLLSKQSRINDYPLGGVKQ